MVTFGQIRVNTVTKGKYGKYLYMDNKFGLNMIREVKIRAGNITT